MALGAMWMSGKVADHAIQLKRDIASMDTSEDKDSKQQILMITTSKFTRKSRSPIWKMKLSLNQFHSKRV